MLGVILLQYKRYHQLLSHILFTSPVNITLLVLLYWFLGVWLIPIDARGVSSTDADPMMGNYPRIVAVVQSRTRVERSG